jgi:hypothetical protein
MGSQGSTFAYVRAYAATQFAATVGSTLRGRGEKYRAEMTTTRSDMGLAGCGTIFADGAHVNNKRYFPDNVLVCYEIRTGANFGGLQWT